MKTTNRLLAAALFLATTLAPAAALAQAALLQASPTTAGHAPMYSTSGAGSQPIAVDSGPAGGGQPGLGLSEILQVNRTPTGTGQNGAHTCFYSAPPTSAAGGYVLCLDALQGSGGLISYSNFGVAPQLPLNILVNGVPISFGGTSTLPQGKIFIGNASNVATPQSVSGDCTISITGVLTCLSTNGVAFGALATSTDAVNLTGTVASARLTGSYTGITGVGTLTAGATGAGFTIALGSSTVTGTLASANGGFGASVAAANGVPLFATGVATFTTTTGSGAFARASGASLTSASLSGASLSGASVSSSSWSGGTITGLPTCVSTTDACPKSYIDSIASGQTPAAPVRLATAAVLPNTPTYANGSSGIGATLTSATNTALVVDGVTPSVADRILVSQQATQFQNGIYVVTTVGSGGAAWVLTRSSDANTVGAGGLVNGLTTAVQAGSTLTGSKWTLTQSNAITIGTTALPWIETSTPVSSVWSSTGSDIYNNNAGNVIIGGTVSAGLLTIIANTDGRIFFTRTATPNSTLGLGTTFDVMNGANVDMRFGNNNAELMRLTAAGSLGLGTTTPGTALDVLSSSDVVIRARTSAGSGTNAAFAALGGASNASWQFGTNRADIAGAGDNFYFFKVAGTAGTKMVIQDSGNIGMGTTAPTTSLDVASASDAVVKVRTSAGSGTNATFLMQGGSSNANWQFGTNRADIAGAADNFFIFKLAGTAGTKMVIQDSGNIGIGTTTPLSLLNVNGTLSLGNTAVVSGASFQMSGIGSGYMSVVNPTMQQAICYGFELPVGSVPGACETDAFVVNLTYTAGASTTGSAIRGTTLLQKGATTGIGVSGNATNYGTGAQSELVGVIGVTSWYGAGSGNAIWAITGGTGPDAGVAGAFEASNKALNAPAWGLRINAESPATVSYVTAIDAADFTSFGVVLRNTKTAGFPIYVTNAGGTNIYNVNAGGSVFSASDARLKHDLGAIPDGALDLIGKLIPRNYAFRDDDTGRKDAGFFAQEVQNVIGEAVESDPNGSLLMTQGPLIAYTVKAIQELKADNDNLRKCLRSAECRLMGLK